MSVCVSVCVCTLLCTECDVNKRTGEDGFVAAHFLVAGWLDVVRGVPADFEAMTQGQWQLHSVEKVRSIQCRVLCMLVCPCVSATPWVPCLSSCATPLAHSEFVFHAA